MASNSVDLVSQTQSASNYAYSPAAASGTDVSDQFMMLLLAQLKNQNPLKPMDDSQMLSQMTSLNTLSELKSISAKIDSMASASQSSYAASLIGKNIVALDEDKGTVQGVVSSMQYLNGQYSLTMGTQTVALEDVIKVSEA